MNHSIIGADRTTHLKIVVVALVAAIVFVAVGITSRFTETGTATAQAPQLIVKAGKPVAVTTSGVTTVR
jgi:hypothetical protein